MEALAELCTMLAIVAQWVKPDVDGTASHEEIGLVTVDALVLAAACVGDLDCLPPVYSMLALLLFQAYRT